VRSFSSAIAYSVDGPNAFYAPEHGDNMWEYYFEPVPQVSYSDIQNRQILKIT
jgi:hypothetical protein